MKKLLLFVAALLLSSCILVDDLGGYWEKGVTDPALVGVWAPADNPSSSADKRIEITLGVDELQANSLNEKERAQKEYKPIFFKILKVPPYTFFMMRDDKDGKKGVLVRYKAGDDVLHLYVMRSAEAAKYLTTRFPEEMKGVTITPTIHVLNERALKLLVAIPDEPAYWQDAGKWVRLPMHLTQ